MRVPFLCSPSSSSSEKAGQEQDSQDVMWWCETLSSLGASDEPIVRKQAGQIGNSLPFNNLSTASSAVVHKEGQGSTESHPTLARFGAQRTARPPTQNQSPVRRFIPHFGTSA